MAWKLGTAKKPHNFFYTGDSPTKRANFWLKKWLPSTGDQTSNRGAGSSGVITRGVGLTYGGNRLSSIWSWPKAIFLGTSDYCFFVSLAYHHLCCTLIEQHFTVRWNSVSPSHRIKRSYPPYVLVSCHSVVLHMTFCEVAIFSVRWRSAALTPHHPFQRRLISICCPFWSHPK